MTRLRPRTTILGGAAVGLVAGVAAFGATASTTVTPPVTKPASFTKVAPVSVAKPPPPVRPKKAPCAKKQELRHGVCIVHVERVVIHYKPAAPVQAMPQPPSRPRPLTQSQPQSQPEPQSRPRANYGGQPQAATPVQRSQQPQQRSSSTAPSSHEAEPREEADTAEHETEISD